EGDNNKDLNNTLFLNYKIINRNSDANYHDVMVGFWSNFYIGCWSRLRFGCDTLLNTYYAYKPFLEDTSCGTNGYLDYPAAQGVTFLNHEMKSFVRYAGGGGPTSYPT